MKNALIMGACLALLTVGSVAKAEQIGSVDTVFKLLGPDT